jgi:CMP-N-acetylneuraminic acid synthetase
MKKIVLLMIAKGTSKRLKNKNKKIYKGKQMFLWNLKKGLSITKNFYFNSDDNEMIVISKKLGLKTIKRDKKLQGAEIPSRLIFDSCLKKMPKNIDGILHIQANSPNIDINLIKCALKMMQFDEIQELLTCDKNYNQYGSLWGITRKRIKKYNMNRNIHDRKVIKPDCYLLDESVDIHNIKDFRRSLKQLSKR